jgi:two-component system, OmpR family, sensor histidine kinase BaeS
MISLTIASPSPWPPVSRLLEVSRRYRRSNIRSLNIIVITSAIVLSGLAIYNTACVLVGSMGNLNDIQQAQFNSVLFNYLLIFVSGTIITASLLHYYLTRKLVKPVQKLIESTKQMEKGEYPAPVPVTARGEIGELTEHFNGLVDQLKANDADRSKMISDLSHEVRTPLTNLNGYLKALRDGVVEGDTELYQSLLNESKRQIYTPFPGLSGSAVDWKYLLQSFPVVS